MACVEHAQNNCYRIRTYAIFPRFSTFLVIFLHVVCVRASIAEMNCTHLNTSILEPLLPTAYLVHIDCGVLNLAGPTVSFAGALN